MPGFSCCVYDSVCRKPEINDLNCWVTEGCTCGEISLA